jgi:hypothetical protein
MVRWQQEFQVLHLQLIGDMLFMTRAGVGSQPASAILSVYFHKQISPFALGTRLRHSQSQQVG